MKHVDPKEISVDFRPLDASGFTPPDGAPPPGPVTMLNWLKIADLRVDPSYQREVGQKGAATIRRIVAAFDWSKFAPVIAAPIEGGFFAVVDGQHRGIAALARGFEQVPACVALLDRAQQAAAFAAINGQVTAIHSTQLFYAKVAAGDSAAEKLDGICRAAGVRILKSPRAAHHMKRGETLAVGALTMLAGQVEPDLLTLALKCVVGTRDGNPGLLRAPVIRALVDVLTAHPDWRGDRLFDALDAFPFAAAWADSVARISGGVRISDAFAGKLAHHLRAVFEGKGGGR